VVKRALAMLTVGALLTLVVDVVGSGRPTVSLLLGGAFALLATVGFAWVQRRQRRWRHAADRGTRMNSPPVRVLLVDDQSLFREALATLLDVRADIDVVGEAGNGDEALRRAAELSPDVVLMDLRMPVLDGIAATRRMRVEQPGIRVIALTTFDDDEDVFAALRAGAVGYLLKDVSSDRLVEAILAAARNESVLQPSVAAKVVARLAQLPDHDSTPRPQPLVVPLSDRELDVVRLLAEGRSNREIAAALFLAEGTVKNHVTNVLAKLGARDRTQAALRARALGLL
jgi:DNA-binding NarL/FixJ family response regulator